MSEQAGDFVLKVAICTLAVILCSMVFAMLYGLYDVRVDNGKIFSILGPAFQTIVGSFVGYVAGLTRVRQP